MSGNGKRKRGLGKRKYKLLSPDEMRVEFDANGKAIGTNALNFMSWVGDEFKHTIPFDKNVNEVDKLLYEHIWNHAKESWKIRDDIAKHQTLMHGKNIMRTFRALLVRKYVKQNRTPFKEYGYLDRDRWEAFVEKVSSEKFQEISKKAQDSGKQNIDPTRLGRGGHAAREHKSIEIWKHLTESNKDLKDVKDKESIKYLVSRATFNNETQRWELGSQKQVKSKSKKSLYSGSERRKTGLVSPGICASSSASGSSLDDLPDIELLNDDVGDDDDDDDVDDVDDDDDDDDVDLLDPMQEEGELVDNVSPMADSLLGDGNIEILDQKQQEQRDSVENVSPMSDSVEKLSSPQSDIICVQGYKVKRSIAHILETIFNKHGDIAANCIFKATSMRSSILEVVCEVVRRIQTNTVIDKMEETECEVSDAEAANVDVTWLRAHLEAINKRKDSGKKYTMLIGMKQNAILVKKAAQKDLRERCDELVVAQQRFTMAERCVRVLNLVENNLNDQIFESKCEMDSLVDHPAV